VSELRVCAARALHRAHNIISDVAIKANFFAAASRYSANPNPRCDPASSRGTYCGRPAAS